MNRDKQRYKALGFYVKSKKYKKHTVCECPALGSMGTILIVAHKYYFTESEFPNLEYPCIYVGKNKMKRKGRIFSCTFIEHNINDTSNSIIWSRWH